MTFERLIREAIDAEIAQVEAEGVLDPSRIQWLRELRGAWLGNPFGGLTEATGQRMLSQLEIIAQALAPGVSQPGYDVFLLAGQSNMVGWSGGGFNPSIDITDDRIRCWPGSGPNLGQIILAQDPLTHRELRGAGDIGLGMTFAREYLDTISSNRSVLLVCAALGGTGFQSSQWNPGDSLHSWAVSAVNQVLALDPNNQLRGILWHQGEADVGNPSYQTQLDAGLSAFRTQITGATNTPIVVGDFVEAWVGSDPARIATQNIIRSTPSRLPRVAHVLATGTVGVDVLHFSAAEYRLMGQRYLNAYQSIVNPTPIAPGQPSGLTLTSATSSGVTLTFNPPVSQGSSPITDYIVQRSVANSNSWTTFIDGVSPGTEIVISGLTPNTEYDFRVAAINAAGQGLYSAIYRASTASVGSTTPGDIVVPDGLLFYYRLSGDYSDAISGNAILGDLVSNPQFANIAPRGQVLDVRQGSRAITNVSITGSYTKSAWILTTTPNQDYQNTLSSSGVGQFHYFGLFSDFSGPSGTANGVTLKATHQDSNTAQIGHTANFLANTWYHIAVTYNAQTQTMRCYVNGSLTNESIGVLPPATPMTSFTLSGFNTALEYRINGYISYLRLHNIALTGQQIADIYAEELI